MLGVVGHRKALAAGSYKPVSASYTDPTTTVGSDLHIMWAWQWRPASPLARGVCDRRRTVSRKQLDAGAQIQAGSG